ncbi:hypothetical protein [Thermaurantiacus sp.]
MALTLDRFVAIDWSGARGARHRGVAVALAEADGGAPALVPPPDPRGWARAEVAEWLEGLGGRVVAGFDFSFAPPFVARGAYLPGIAAPETGPGFWAFVEAHCREDADYGAHGFMEGVARRHFWMGAADGPKADFLHWRVCEAAFNAQGGGKASTVFDCVGAAQVARASFSGMRLLHRLRRAFAVWPFDPPGPRTVVEIYTRAMLRHAGGAGRKLRSRDALAQALAALGCAAPVGRFSDHETDVLVAAAALRHMAAEPHWWAPTGLTEAVARTEGWTFGIAGPSG